MFSFVASIYKLQTEIAIKMFFFFVGHANRFIAYTHTESVCIFVADIQIDVTYSLNVYGKSVTTD